MAHINIINVARAAEKNVEIILPTDFVCGNKFSADAEVQHCTGKVPAGWMGLDQGPESNEACRKAILKAKTILWNGPMGVFEVEPFAPGTVAVAKAVAESAARSVVGGGDSVAAIGRAGVADAITHVSTGGGASLELLGGRTLPGVDVLPDAGEEMD